MFKWKDFSPLTPSSIHHSLVLGSWPVVLRTNQRWCKEGKEANRWQGHGSLMHCGVGWRGWAALCDPTAQGCVAGDWSGCPLLIAPAMDAREHQNWRESGLVDGRVHLCLFLNASRMQGAPVCHLHRGVLSLER